MIITIGGDISVRDSRNLFEECRGEELFSDVISVFEASDRVIVNLECAVTDKDTPIEKIGPNLNAPLNTVKTLKSVGVTDCVLSNNHILDYGEAGVRDTVEQLEKYGINYTGLGENEQDARKNLVITDGKIKIAVIAVCEHEYSYALSNKMGARAYDPYDTADDIIEAKANADYVIVIYHGGKEECRYPSPRLLKACRSMIKRGADVVLCQHSHCVGCYERFMDGHILYGQGNFHFVCKSFESKEDGGRMWNTGLLAKISFENGVSVDFIPCVVDGYGIRLAREDEAKEELDALYERSETLKNGKWYEHWRSFALAQGRYKVVPSDLYEEIAHFIDCEAHADVCREIYQTGWRNEKNN